MPRASFAELIAKEWSAIPSYLLAIFGSGKNPDGSDFSLPVTVVSSGGSGALTDHSGEIEEVDTSQLLMAANPNRRYLFIQNVGADDLWIDIFGNAAVKDQPSIKLPPNSYYCEPFVSTAAIHAISASTIHYTAMEASTLR